MLEIGLVWMSIWILWEEMWERNFGISPENAGILTLLE